MANRRALLGIVPRWVQKPPMCERAFDHGHALAALGGLHGGPFAAGPGAENHHVVMDCVHKTTCRESVSDSPRLRGAYRLAAMREVGLGRAAASGGSAGAKGLTAATAVSAPLQPALRRGSAGCCCVMQ